MPVEPKDIIDRYLARTGTPTNRIDDYTHDLTRSVNLRFADRYPSLFEATNCIEDGFADAETHSYRVRWTHESEQSYAATHTTTLLVEKLDGLIDRLATDIQALIDTLPKGDKITWNLPICMAMVVVDPATFEPAAMLMTRYIVIHGRATET